MARITEISTVFTDVGPVSAEEWWQVHDGVVLVSFEAGADPHRGIAFRKGEVIPVAAGKTVYYRRLSKSATISREVIG